MRNENGELEMDPNNVRKIATNFLVLPFCQISKDIRQNRMKVWAKIQPKVTQAMQDSLMSPIIELELEQALHSLSGQIVVLEWMDLHLNSTRNIGGY